MNVRIIEDFNSGGVKHWIVQRRSWLFWFPVDMHFGKRYSPEYKHSTLADAEALVKKLSEPGRIDSRRVVAEYEIKQIGK